MGGERVFYSPKVRSQSSSESLNCELYKCFSVCSPPLGGVGCLHSAGVGYFPSLIWKARGSCSRVFSFPQASDSDKNPAGEALIK